MRKLELLIRGDVTALKRNRLSWVDQRMSTQFSINVSSQFEENHTTLGRYVETGWFYGYYLANIVACLVAYSYQEKKPALNLRNTDLLTFVVNA